MHHLISNSTIPLIHIQKNREVRLSGFDTLCSSHYQYLEGFITPVPVTTCVNGVNAHWEGNKSCRRSFLAISVSVCLSCFSLMLMGQLSIVKHQILPERIDILTLTYWTLWWMVKRSNIIRFHIGRSTTNQVCKTPHSYASVHENF